MNAETLAAGRLAALLRGTAAVAAANGLPRLRRPCPPGRAGGKEEP